MKIFNKLLFLFAFSANIALASEIVIESNQTKVVDKFFPSVLNSLTMKDGSTLELSPDLKKMEFVVGELIIGENVLITTQGLSGKTGENYTGRQSRRKHGHGKGANGRKGGNGECGSLGREIKISTDKLEFVSFVLNTSGGNGGKGGNGEGGGKGTNGSCDGHSGGAGGNGGRGGNGGSGAKPGVAEISVNSFLQVPNDQEQLSATPYKWIAKGGKGGARGVGGKGGKGGNSASCGLTSQKGGNGGNKGKNGKPGNEVSDIENRPFIKFN